MSPESSRKTHSAPEGVKVYADGSFYKQFNLGAWAYRVPVLGLAESGVGSGHSSKHFELQAAVLAISAADRALGGGSAIHLFSDCSFTMRWIAELNERLAGKRHPKRFPQTEEGILGDLFAIMRRRRVRCRRANPTTPEHLRCHTEARRHLRAVINEHPDLRLKYLLACANDQMKALVRRQRDLTRSTSLV